MKRAAVPTRELAECSGGGPVTEMTRLRAAVMALSEDAREMHARALAFLLHVLADCREGREPRAFIACRGAYDDPRLRWAATQLRRLWILCPGSSERGLGCPDPMRVTLFTEPLVSL